MGKSAGVSCVMEIGKVAGIVWQTLSDDGPMTIAKLVAAVGQPRDSVMQAVGWLAREDKIELEPKGRSVWISLRGEA